MLGFLKVLFVKLDKKWVKSNKQQGKNLPFDIKINIFSLSIEYHLGGGDSWKYISLPIFIFRISFSQMYVFPSLTLGSEQEDFT